MFLNSVLGAEVLIHTPLIPAFPVLPPVLIEEKVTSGVSCQGFPHLGRGGRKGAGPLWMPSRGGCQGHLQGRAPAQEEHCGPEHSLVGSQQGGTDTGYYCSVVLRFLQRTQTIINGINFYFEPQMNLVS